MKGGFKQGSQIMSLLFILQTLLEPDFLKDQIAIKGSTILKETVSLMKDLERRNIFYHGDLLLTGLNSHISFFKMMKNFLESPQEPGTQIFPNQYDPSRNINKSDFILIEPNGNTVYQRNYHLIEDESKPLLSLIHQAMRIIEIQENTIRISQNHQYDFWIESSSHFLSSDEEIKKILGHNEFKKIRRQHRVKFHFINPNTKEISHFTLYDKVPKTKEDKRIKTSQLLQTKLVERGLAKPNALFQLNKFFENLKPSDNLRQIASLKENTHLFRWLQEKEGHLSIANPHWKRLNYVTAPSEARVQRLIKVQLKLRHLAIR